MTNYLSEMERLKAETETLETQKAHWQARCDAALTDLETQKQVKNTGK